MLLHELASLTLLFSPASLWLISAPIAIHRHEIQQRPSLGAVRLRFSILIFLFVRADNSLKSLRPRRMAPRSCTRTRISRFTRASASRASASSGNNSHPSLLPLLPWRMLSDRRSPLPFIPRASSSSLTLPRTTRRLICAQQARCTHALTLCSVLDALCLSGRNHCSSSRRRCTWIEKRSWRTNYASLSSRD